MKKVVLSFAVAAAFALASCGGNTTTTDAEQVQEQTPEVEVIEEVTTVVVDSTVAVVDSIVAVVDSVVAE